MPGSPRGSCSSCAGSGALLGVWAGAGGCRELRRCDLDSLGGVWCHSLVGFLLLSFWRKGMTSAGGVAVILPPQLDCSVSSACRSTDCSVVHCSPGGTTLSNDWYPLAVLLGQCGCACCRGLCMVTLLGFVRV